jgi:hypothetical protein
MQYSVRKVFVFLFMALGFASGQGAPVAHTVILQENGFPVADSATISDSALRQGFANAQMVTAAQLSGALADPSVRLLVLPYGSAYPEQAWPAILRYLERGGNLVVLGGKPFTRAAYQTAAGWQLRDESVAASLELYIADYQKTAGSAALSFEANPDVSRSLPAFRWTRAFSPVIRLSAVPLLTGELGPAGSEDASITTLAWGAQGGHKKAAPAILVDHSKHRFVGGRWILVACEPEDHALDNPQLLAGLQALALRKGDRFSFRPRLPLFVPGEALEFRFEPANRADLQRGDTLEISVRSEDGKTTKTLTAAADSVQSIVLPPEAAEGNGLHSVEATLMRGGAALWTDRTAFWMRDWEYLKSGPKLTVGNDYFQLDGKPLPVVGTTYMGSDVGRLYLAEPNVATWDRDMAQIHAAGLNMIRSGIWSGWSLLTRPDGSFTEDALRSIEAFLMTARRNNLPVQFNLFAFLPDSLGGDNAYLDPAALAAQDRYVRSIVGRFHDVPFLAWDLINEPSANKNYWRTLPIGDAYEQAAWRDWLKHRYPDQAALLAAWNEPSLGVGRALQSKPPAMPPTVAAQDPLAMPEAGAFEADAVRSGYNTLKVYDYTLFTQKIFSDWAARQRSTIRATGSSQLITVGQDEGGVAGRVSPAFYSPQLDFTSDHTWWDYDAILWASLAAKFPGKPMLIQEMGSQRRMMQDDRLRLSAEEEGWQLERKLALSFAQGAGGLEWVWNVNARMANDNETPIGAVRPDGTEKPEAKVLAGFARFAAQSPVSFTEMEAPQVTLVTSQSFIYSDLGGLAYAAQKKALRALTYFDHTPARMLADNRIEELGTPKLVILPAAQALTETAWQQLLDYVSRGGCLLVSGPVARDEHWHFVDRTSPLNLQAALVPLALRLSAMRLPGQTQPMDVSYPPQVQQSPLELLRFKDGAGLEQIAHGKGRILWASDPVEFAENYEPAAALYEYALGVAGVAPAYLQIHPLSPGVLAFPTVLKDAVLYSFSSESMDDREVDIKDRITGANLHFNLAAQRGAVVLLDRATGKVLASYGVESGNAQPAAK